MAVLDTDIKYYKSLGVASGVPSCGGAIDTGSLLTGALHELFDVISASEANGTNRVEYRLIYVQNTNVTDTLFVATVDVETDSSSTATTLALAIDAVGHNTASTTTLVDEIDSTTLLSGLTFVNTGTTIDIGDSTNNELKTLEFTPIWVRRSLVTPAASTPSDLGTLRVSGEVA